MTWPLVLLLWMALCCIGGYAVGYGAAWSVDRLRHADTYEPAASETPEEAAWRDVQEVLVSDIPDDLEVEVYDAIRRHKDGEDVTAGAPREAL